MGKKLWIVFTALLFLVAYSCRDELFHSDSEPSLSESEILVIDAARLFYNERIHYISMPKTGIHTGEKNTQDSASLQKTDYLYTDSMDAEQSHDAETSLHQHSVKCSHGLSTRAASEEDALPELKESNIVLEWDRARVWEDSLASYVEVPLDMGGQIFALKRLEEENRDARFERTRTESMLVFAKKRSSDNMLCYVVTLVGDKSYLKSAGDKTKTLRHKPRGTDFTGTVFYSYLSGRIKRAFYYDQGKATHKLVKRTDAASASAKSLSISFFDMSVNGAAYTRSYEYFCFICYNYHDFDDADVCDFAQIVNCRTCQRPEDDCECCYNCLSYP